MTNNGGREFRSDSFLKTEPEKDVDGLAARGNWGGQFEFLLTCVGYAVGLGNVWRFPYLCYQNGGGAFLFPYILMLIVIGLPVFYFELSFGQFASLGPISVWSVSPLFKGIGFAMVSTSWMLSLYYIIIVAWAFYFLFASFTTKLPWTDCVNDWNTQKCVTSLDMHDMIQNETLLNMTLAEKNASSIEELKTPSEEYFYIKVLQRSEGIADMGEPVWELALCLLLSWLVVFLVLLKGIQSLGKVVYFSSLFPYVMLTVLVVRGATLEGAQMGVEFYLAPDPSKLADPMVWTEAATMVFFSLSACSGGLIAMSSYNDFKNNCLRDALIVPLVVGLTSLYSGFAIFTVLGFMATMKGVAIDKVAAEGPGLVFVVYPEALTRMPAPPIWSVLFFLMLLTLGFSSEFSWVEAPFVAIMDEFPDIFRVNKTRPIILRAVCISCYFLITLPMITKGGFYLFSLTDYFVSGFPLLFIGLTEMSVVNYVYGYKRFSEDIALMLGRTPNPFFRICWNALTPLILLTCIIVKAVKYEPYSLEDSAFPGWAQAVGWLQVAFILSWIPMIAIIVVCIRGNILTVIKRTARPDESWGPAAPKHRIGTRYDEANRIDTFPGVALDHPITNSVYSLPPPSYPDYIERTAAASEGGGDTATDQTYL